MNTMAQPPTQPARPPFYNHHSPTAASGMAAPGFSPPSSQMAVPHPPPYQHSQPFYPQPPAPKRARLSPGPASPFPSPGAPQVQSPPAGSLATGTSTNGFPLGPAPPGSMGPPSRPADKGEDRNFDDVLAGTGINIEEEERRLTAGDYYSQPTPSSSFQSAQASFHSFASGSTERPGSRGQPNGLTSFGFHGAPDATGESPPSPAEMQRRREAGMDWDAARYAQHALWGQFLCADSVLKRIISESQKEHLLPPQNGVLRPAKDAKPSATQVNGLDGSSRIIDQGQAILSTGAGDGLKDTLDVICLAAKERLTGLIDLSARLSYERRHHSTGRVPVEWQSMAAVSAGSPAAAPSLKRTHADADGESTTATDLVAAPHRIASIFQKVSQADRLAEEKRLARRAQRTTSVQPDPVRSASVSAGGPDPPAAVAEEAEKKTTKKERKLAETKFTEQQQHRSANETARLATAGLLGLGRKGKKNYSWLSGAGGAGTSGTSTPTKAESGSAPASAAATPASARTPAAPKSKLFGSWDETQDPGIQARDVLLVLETDGKAPRSYMKGYSKPEK